MSSCNIKFSNNSQGLSFTAQSVSANGKDISVASLTGFSTSTIAGKTINQIEIVSSQGGKQQLIVKTPGAGKNDKSALSPNAGNNIINYDQPINVDTLSIVLTQI